MSEPKIVFGYKDQMMVECNLMKRLSDCQLNDFAINCDGCKLKEAKERAA